LENGECSGRANHLSAKLRFLFGGNFLSLETNARTWYLGAKKDVMELKKMLCAPGAGAPDLKFYLKEERDG
jgi:hypothetical protein